MVQLKQNIGNTLEAYVKMSIGSTEVRYRVALVTVDDKFLNPNPSSPLPDPFPMYLSHPLTIYTITMDSPQARHHITEG